jgi:hypothetical protein
VNPLPAGDCGDAVERLRDEQWHILELFDTYARHRRDADQRVTEFGRLATLIFTLLRVHCELETMLLRTVQSEAEDFQRAASEVAARRDAMLEALERAEALSPRDPAHAQEMTTLAERVRAWFHADEQQMFALAQRGHVDLVTLDREMASRQEVLLSAGRNFARVGAA